MSRRIAPDPARLAEFAKTLSEASSPVLIYGGGVARVNGWEEELRLQKRLARQSGPHRIPKEPRFPKRIRSMQVGCRRPSSQPAKNSKGTT